MNESQMSLFSSVERDTCNSNDESRMYEDLCGIPNGSMQHTLRMQTATNGTPPEQEITLMATMTFDKNVNALQG